VDLLPTASSAAAARIWAGLDKPWQEAFRQAWEALRTGNIAVGACVSTPAGEIVCSGGEMEHLAAMDVVEGLGYLWPRLRDLTDALPA
jgi:hypothetical protein